MFIVQNKWAWRTTFSNIMTNSFWIVFCTYGKQNKTVSVQKQLLLFGKCKEYLEVFIHNRYWLTFTNVESEI